MHCKGRIATVLRRSGRVVSVGGLVLAVVTGAAVEAQAYAPRAVDVLTSTPGQVTASGEFTAGVDLTTAVLREVGGHRCELTVEATLTFTGALVGVAEGTTTALIFAPCEAVVVTPPGTFRDLFRFEGEFTGTVNGSPVTGQVTYAGRTRPGGAIDAVMTLHGSAVAVLRVEAMAAQGGTYAGVATVRPNPA